MATNRTTAGKTAKKTTRTTTSTGNAARKSAKPGTPGTASTPGTIEERRAARIERWRKIAAERIQRIDAHGRELLEAAATATGREVVDFVVEALKADRGLIPARETFEARCNRETDDRYEDGPTRSRNNNDRVQVLAAIMLHTMLHADGLTPAEEVALVRRYFRDGDKHLAEAEGRAIRDALKAKND